MTRKGLLCAMLALAVSVCSLGCSGLTAGSATQDSYDDVPLAAPAPEQTATPDKAAFDPDSIFMPEASGEAVQSACGITMDYSNADQGYVMLMSEGNEKKIKIAIEANGSRYYYTLPDSTGYVTFPLQFGNGKYTVTGYENISSDQYSTLFNWELEIEGDELSPFLYPSQYVSYTASDQCVYVSYSLCAGLDDSSAKADALYRYVADNIEYDYDKADAVQKGYLPVPDDTLSTGKGICFDYAALLAAMLRVQFIPARLVMGNVAPEDFYHAWNSAYLDGAWKHMDATLDGGGYVESDYTATKYY